MASGFELPFGWDDGHFIAPFVATRVDTLSDVLSALARLPSGALRAGETFVDAGCGDGRVALFVAQAAFPAAVPSVPESESCDRDDPATPNAAHAVVLGIDLDDQLIDTARARAAALGLAPPRVSFVCGDIRDAVATLAAADVVFLYMLPGDVLSDIVAKVTAHWAAPTGCSSSAMPARCRAVLSNTWPVQCLARFEAFRIGEIYAYCRRAPRELTASAPD